MGPFEARPTRLLAGRDVWCVLGTLLACSLVSPAQAQDTGQRISQIEQQIQALQDELRAMKRELAARDNAVKAAQAEAGRARAQASAAAALAARPPVAAAAAVPPPDAAAPPPPATTVAASEPKLPLGTFRLGGVTVTLGGFIEAAGIYRTRNEVADIASNWNTGIPYPNVVTNHENEFRGSARQSRVSLLVQGEPDDASKLAAYVETDFLGAAPTANSAESNSYNLRLRQAYATYDRNDWGLHFLGGQAWSLITLNKVGITPRQENVPLTIDAQYVPGFTWTRNWQVRATQDLLDHQLWLGVSIEGPQASYYTGPNGTGVPTGSTVNLTNAGGSNFASTNTYSDDIAPDIVAKVAYDPGYGHYEIYGLARFFHDRVSEVGAGHSITRLGGGGGAGFIVPILPGMLDLQASALAGYGIGRYGSAQLPDAVVSSTGVPDPLPEVEALGGLILHPVKAVDVYGYVGTEQIGHRYFESGGKGYGYGSPLYSNAGCLTELSTASCTANTSGVVQGSLGAWWRFLQGNFGTVEAGAQYSYTRRSIFAGTPAFAGGNGKPSVDENVFLVAFRYIPFQ